VTRPLLTIVNGAKRLLLGREDSWGARLGTGPLAIHGLALVTIISHSLDLATGLRMMLVHGVALEQNPIIRSIMLNSGPLVLIELKLGVVVAGVALFVRTAQLGRARLARNCLLVSLGIGVLGAASNLVG
jgi:hypothetical protein